MKEKEITVKNLKASYKIFGDGKAFLILHGWGSGSDRWKEVAEIISKKGFRVIVPDLPGFGKSQELAEVWGIDAYVEWVSEFCQNVKDLNDTFYLLGHSFGGAVSSKFSIKYSQKVEKLFLVAPSGIRKKTAKKKFLEKIAKVSGAFSSLPFYGFARKVFYKLFVGGNDYMDVKGIMKENFLKIVAEDLSHRLAFIKVPTVIIWGDKDNLTPINHSEIFHKKIENSKLILIPGAPHALQISSPDILAEKILENV